MHFSVYAPLALAANLVAALPRPQEIDFDIVLAAPDPTFSEAVGVAAQTITINTDALIASATAAVSSVAIDVTDVLSATAVVQAKRAAATCVKQAPGATSVPDFSSDTAVQFQAENYFSSVASANAAAPTGYTQAFVNKQASNNAFGYMGFDTMDDYDVARCASQCTAKYGCSSFNIYFERDPSVDPNGSLCSNPAPVTMIKCVYWSGQVTAVNAVNVGQIRGGFTVAIAGNNGYVTTRVSTPDGYKTGVPYGQKAINAPYDAQGYNTFMGSKMFTEAWDVTQCSKYCEAQTAYNVKTAVKGGAPAKVCRFFNTYLLQAKTAEGKILPQGQYCSLYTEAWSEKQATNSGSWQGKTQYTIDYSFGFSTIDAGKDPLVGDAEGATYQAVADIKWSSLQPFCSTYLGYTIPLSTVTATATITPVVTSTSYSTTTVTPKRKRDDTGSLYPGLSMNGTGSPVVIDGNGNKWYDMRDSISSSSASASGLNKRLVPVVSIPAGLSKYQATVISAACSMQVTQATSTITLTSAATVTGAATTTVVSIVSTATAVPTDNLVVTMTGGLFKSGPLLFPTVYEPEQPWAGLREYPFGGNPARSGAFVLDASTGRLIDSTTGDIASAYYVLNGGPRDLTVLQFRSAANLAANANMYKPISCTRSAASGELACSLTASSGVVLSFNMGYKDQNFVGVFFAASSASAVNQFYQSNFGITLFAAETLTLK